MAIAKDPNEKPFNWLDLGGNSTTLQTTQGNVSLGVIKGSGSISLPPGSEHWGSTTIAQNTINTVDHAIRGQLVYAEHIFEREIIEDRIQTPEKIKELLMLDLAKKMMDNKMIEFTRTENVNTGQYHYRARAFVVPDTNVRILREAGMLAKPSTT